MEIEGGKSKLEMEILKTLAVLYVEDDHEVQQQLSLFLEPKVGKLYTAFNGQEALEAYKKYKPDVIITDIRMPIMDGLELAKAIREIDKDIPIIVTTAFNEPEYRLQSFDVGIGIERYILKPTDPYSLLDTIVKSVTSQKKIIANI
jgi:CheY-like chemotaxis protein